MIIYFIILGLSYLFIYLGEKYRLKFGIFIICGGIGIISFAGFRYGVGIDSISYWSIYELININPNFKIELGFKYLCKFLILLGLGPQALFFVMSTATTIFLYKASIYYVRNHIAIVIFVFLFAGFYLESFNLMRQCFSIGIFFYASKYIVKQCFRKFLVYMIVGALFHSATFMLIPFYWILRVEYKKWHLLLILALGILCGFIISIDNIFKLIPYYGEAYLIEYKDYNSSADLKLGFISKVIIALVAILFYNQIIKKFQHHKIVITAFIYYVALMSLFREYMVFLRFSYYFHIFMIVLFPAFTMIVDNKSKYVINTIIYTYCLLLCYVILSDSDMYYYPYQFNIDIFTFERPQR